MDVRSTVPRNRPLGVSLSPCGLPGRTAQSSGLASGHEASTCARGLFHSIVCRISTLKPSRPAVQPSIHPSTVLENVARSTASNHNTTVLRTTRYIRFPVLKYPNCATKYIYPLDIISTGTSASVFEDLRPPSLPTRETAFLFPLEVKALELHVGGDMNEAMQQDSEWGARKANVPCQLTTQRGRNPPCARWWCCSCCCCWITTSAMQLSIPSPASASLFNRPGIICTAPGQDYFEFRFIPGADTRTATDVPLTGLTEISLRRILVNWHRMPR